MRGLIMTLLACMGCIAWCAGSVFAQTKPTKPTKAACLAEWRAFDQARAAEVAAVNKDYDEQLKQLKASQSEQIKQLSAANRKTFDDLHAARKKRLGGLRVIASEFRRQEEEEAQREFAKGAREIRASLSKKESDHKFERYKLENSRQKKHNANFHARKKHEDELTRKCGLRPIDYKAFDTR